MPTPETPAELREAYETGQKELKKLQKQVDTLSHENRKFQAMEAFREAELSPNLADLFVATNPEAEITADAATAFAATYGLTATGEPQVESEEGTPEGGAGGGSTDGREGLEQLARAGSGQGGGGQPPASEKVLTRDEFLKLQSENAPAAAQALAEGRVKLRGDNPMGTGSVPTVGQNPFTHGREDE